MQWDRDDDDRRKARRQYCARAGQTGWRLDSWANNYSKQDEPFERIGVVRRALLKAMLKLSSLHAPAASRKPSATPTAARDPESSSDKAPSAWHRTWPSPAKAIPSLSAPYRLRPPRAFPSVV